MTGNNVKERGLRGLRVEAREALGRLSLPGAPDEAWRRLPPEVLDGFMEPAFGGNIVPGSYELRKNGPGGLIQLGQEDSDEVIARWAAVEQSRRALRLERANDVEDNLLSALHLAYADSFHSLHFDEKNNGIGKVTEIEIRLSETVDSPVRGIYLPFLIVEVARGGSADLRVRVTDGGKSPVKGILQLIFLLEAESQLKYSYSEEGGPEDVWFTFEKSYQGENSTLHLGHSHTSCGVSMRDGRHAILGKGGRFEAYTLCQPGGDGFTGQKISVEQYSPFTSSNVETRSVLGSSSASVFVGAIKIPEGAAGSEGYEEHRSLLLSPTARVQSLPELEIVENDVRCSHASTVMEPEGEELFYLESRGIGKEEARKVLGGAFVRQVQSKMPGYQREVNEDE
jgi:Fe-S cluster assembly scaffold protein SufB